MAFKHIEQTDDEERESQRLKAAQERVYQELAKERADWIRRFDDYIMAMICHETTFDANAVIRLASTLADKRAEIVKERFKDIDQILEASSDDD